MEAKRTIRMQKITLAEIMGSVEVLTKKQLKQIKGERMIRLLLLKDSTDWFSFNFHLLQYIISGFISIG